jgi:protein-disulfide isomerase
MSTVDDEQELTRKQRREQAREQRKEAERAAAATETRRRRLIQLGGVLGVVVVIIVVILIATGGGGSKTPGPVKAHSSQETKLVAEVNSILGGIPESGNALGRASAPVTLVYFGDLQCPFCGEFSRTALTPLIQRFVRAGKLRIEYRNLQTATHEPEVFRTQQIAAMAAGKQNLAWYYLELFYRQQGTENSGYVSEEFLRRLATQVPGLNTTSWLAARSNPEFATQITTDAQAANNAGFNGTPSFQIGRTGGALKKFEYESLTSPAAFEKAIESLAKA